MRSTFVSVLLLLFSAEVVAQSGCPADVGYIRDKLVFTEIKGDPSFPESLDGMIKKAGGVDYAIREVESLIRDTEVSKEQAAQTAKQSFSGSGSALATRCAKPAGTYCSANYSYHLMKEAVFYYQELLNGLLCRKTGKMARGNYTPAPLP